MAKTVYYSKRYNNRFNTSDNENNGGATFTPAPRRTMGRLVPLILLACLVLAVASVLVVPMLVGGTTPAQSQQSRAQARGVAPEAAAAPVAVAYDDAAAAVAALDINPALPTALPDGYALGAVAVLDGTVLELQLDGPGAVVLRCAAGNEDLSGMDLDALAFSTYEETGVVTRRYAGASEDALYAAVWVSGDYTYALVSAEGLNAETMRLLAEPIA